MLPGRLAVVSGLLALSVAACGGGTNGLSESDIRGALERLPYRFDYRRVSYLGDGSVVAGIARAGPHNTYFAVIAGDPKIDGRVVPRQRRPSGRLQHGVDSTHGSSGAPWETEFVYTHTSMPRISEDISTAVCEAAGGKNCRGL